MPHRPIDYRPGPSSCQTRAAPRQRRRRRLRLSGTMISLRIAWRQLLHDRGVTAAVVATLGLGIGANTAVFSLVNDVLLRSLPVRNPGELEVECNINGQGGRLSRAGEHTESIDPATGRDATSSFSFLTWTRFRDNHPALSHLFAH